MAGGADRRSLEKRDFEALSTFRYRLRRFLRFSETVVRKAGITPLQYLLLLHIKGYPGRDWATLGELAERLQAYHNGTVALVTRCEELGLVRRKVNAEDRRRVEVHLTGRGERRVRRLAALHRDELMRSEVLAPHIERQEKTRDVRAGEGRRLRRRSGAV
jgi:DNA-binding MarR family transcriptional regulator